MVRLHSASQGSNVFKVCVCCMAARLAYYSCCVCGLTSFCIAPYESMAAILISYCFFLYFLCLSAKFRNVFLMFPLSHRNEILQDDRSRCTLGLLLFWWTLVQEWSLRKEKFSNAYLTDFLVIKFLNCNYVFDMNFIFNCYYEVGWSYCVHFGAHCHISQY